MSHFFIYVEKGCFCELGTFLLTVGSGLARFEKSISDSRIDALKLLRSSGFLSKILIFFFFSRVVDYGLGCSTIVSESSVSLLAITKED